MKTLASKAPVRVVDGSCCADDEATSSCCTRKGRGTPSPRSRIPIQPTRARPFHRPGWIQEEKHDGWLGLGLGARDRLVSHVSSEHSAMLPQLVAVGVLPTERFVFSPTLRFLRGP